MIILSLIFGIFLLFCTAYIFYKFSLKLQFVLPLAVGILTIGLFFLNDSLNLIGAFTIIGAAAGSAYKNNNKIQTFIIISSLLVTLLFTSNHYYYKLIKNFDILKNSRDKFIEIIQENNSTLPEKAEIIKKLNDSVEIMTDMIPFIYFLNSIIMTFFCLFLLKFIFVRKHPEKENRIATIDSFRIKEFVVFIFIAAWAVVLLVDKKYYVIYVTGLNAGLILSCIYLLQSIGIIKYFFKKRNIPFAVIPVFMLLLLFVGIEYFLFVLIFLSGIGVIDFWADFRKLNTENKKT